MNTEKMLERDVVEMLSYPSGYSLLRGGIELWDWQVQVLDWCEPRGSRVALRTCNESGKTQIVIAWLCLWQLETFANSRVVTTSGSNNQIQDQLYPALRAITRGWHGWEVLRNRVRAPNGSEMISYSTNHPGRAEGWHEGARTGAFHSGHNLLSEYGVSDAEWLELCDASNRSELLMVMDEAKTVPLEIWEAWERCHPTRLLVASSPGGPSGPFFDCFHRESHRYRCRQVTYEDCPHLRDDVVKRRAIDEMIALRGRDDPFVASMAFGEFSSKSKYGVFDAFAVERAMGGTLPRWGIGEKRAAIDLSAGGDEQVLYYRDGNEARLIRTWHERDDEKFVRELVSHLERLNLRPEWVYADNGGLGRIILNNLERKGWPVNRIDFGGSPKNPRWYADVRTEMYFELGDRVRLGEVRLPADSVLKEQLLWHEYKVGDGPKRLIPKDQMPNSPDRSDTVAMLFYTMRPAEQFRLERSDIDRKLSHTLLPRGATFGDAAEVTSMW